MKSFAVCLVIISAVVLDGCCKRPDTAPDARYPKSISEVENQLLEQFRKQHESHKQFAASRIEEVTIIRFAFPTPSPRPYLGVGIKINGIVSYSDVPIVQLGDGLFAVTFRDSTTGEELSAIISFR